MRNIILFLILFICSCSVHHEVTSHGKSTIITNDTTYIDHGGFIGFKPLK